eukprot:893234-Pleurochrysis_carterae.AAC.2
MNRHRSGACAGFDESELHGKVRWKRKSRGAGVQSWSLADAVQVATSGGRRGSAAVARFQRAPRRAASRSRR